MRTPLWLYLRFTRLQLDLLQTALPLAELTPLSATSEPATNNVIAAAPVTVHSVTTKPTIAQSFRSQQAPPVSATIATAAARATASQPRRAEPAANNRSTQAACHTKAAADPAIIIVEPQQLQVLQLNAAAYALGIRVSMSLAMACALSAQLQVIPWQSARETAYLQQLADQLYLICADIVLDPPAALWLKLDPMLQLYHGLDGFLSQLQQQLASWQPVASPPLSIQPLSMPPVSKPSAAATEPQLQRPAAASATASAAMPPASPVLAPQLSYQLATGDSAVAAKMLCLHQPGFCSANPQLIRQQLRNCPLTVSPLSTQLQQQLQRLGIRQLAALQDLPRQSLAQRFAAELGVFLQHIEGKQAEVLTFYAPSGQFQQSTELLYQLERQQQLLAPLQQLLLQLQRYLQLRDQRCYQLELTLLLRDVPPLCLQIQSPQAEDQAERWLKLLALRLEQLKLPAPVLQLTLSASQYCARGGTARDLFAGVQGQLTPLQLTALLQAKLGAARVCRLYATDSHQPEQANQLQPLTGQANLLHSHPNGYGGQVVPKLVTTKQAAAKQVATTSAQQLASPFTNQFADKLTGQTASAGLLRPSLLFSQPRPLQQQLHLQAGVERLLTPWWQGGPELRDYFIGRTVAGQWCWVYRTRAQQWFVQGYFA